MNFKLCHRLIRNKIKQLMSKRRSHKHTEQRASFAVQSDQAQILKVQQQLSKIQNGSKMRVLQSHRQKSTKLANGTQKSKNSLSQQSQVVKQQQSNRKAILQPQKSKASKNMKLQNQSIDLHNNVLEITIKDSCNNSSYISALQQQLHTLRHKIQMLQEQQNSKMFKRTMPFDEFPSYTANSQHSQLASRTIEPRRSLCGKIYYRGETPNSERRSSRYNSKLQQATNYKRQSTNSEHQFSDVEGFSKSISSNNKNPQDISKLANYRVKASAKKVKRQNTQNEPKKVTIKQDEQQKKQKVEQVSEQLKTVFQQKPQWQIKDINDDFRQKITNKLQIPSIFPISPPEVSEKMSVYQQMAEQVYKSFKIDIGKCKDKLIVRRFKNGVYFQLKPNKNVVWYFNGAFYFGDWETDLPSEGEKNGFGFQYIPNKYYYLGNFKNGMRNGKGSIKIINQKNPNSNEFTAYDGQWLNGKPHGHGKHMDEKNNKYIGQFEEGQKTGKAIILNKDGLYYEGQVKGGLKHGYGAQKLVNGDTYVGEFAQGKFQGHGVYKWKNGSVYEGSFEKGKRQGKGKWKSYNGDQFEGEYVNDIKNGWGKFVWANGQVYEGQFRNDLRHGEGTYKHPKGKMGKFMWLDGQIDHRLYSKQQQAYRCRHIGKQEQEQEQQ